MSSTPPLNTLEDLWPEGEVEQIEQGANPRRALLIGGGLLLVLFLLAALVPIGGAVIASGQVGVESRVKRIAHPTGGIIAEIPVENGQAVEAGQLLMRLEDIVSGAEAEFSSLSVEQLLAQRARLQAEQNGADRLIFPPALTSSDTPSAAQAMRQEASLFTTRQSEQRQIRAQLQARITQFDEQIRGYLAQISALERQAELIGPELEGVRDLWERDLVTIGRLNELERTAANIDGNIASLRANIAQSNARISETREQLIQLNQTRRIEAAVQLDGVNAALNDQQVRSVSAGDRLENSEIRAPYAGTVEKLAYTTIGDVVRAAEPIMEIVPEGELTVIEAMASPADVDQLAAGQSARIRFTAFSYSATPEIPGTVTYVATDRSTDQATGMPFFTVRIAIDLAEVETEGLELRSGMPAEVFISTGSRTLLSYLTRPLRDQFERSFRGE